MRAEVTYQEEAWSAVLPELEACLQAHWQEVADRDLQPLALDYGAYAQLEAAGSLHVVTMRAAGHLVGYHVTCISRHINCVSVLCGFVALYYVQPAYRAGWLPVALFRQAERLLQARGVDKLFSSYKVTAPLEPLFRRLRWVACDVAQTKWIGAF